MEVVYQRVAGLDVHKKTVVACVRVLSSGSDPPLSTVRTFGTMTDDLRMLADWLAAQSVTHVAMESTGVYWKPVFNLLEERFTLLLCNAHHVKQVPGRKTDVKDCEWLAQLLQFGLLRGSFIPPLWQRELRDLTRTRRRLTQDRSSVARRQRQAVVRGQRHPGQVRPSDHSRHHCRGGGPRDPRRHGDHEAAGQDP